MKEGQREIGKGAALAGVKARFNLRREDSPTPTVRDGSWR